jgi:hypothetical protein
MTRLVVRLVGLLARLVAHLVVSAEFSTIRAASVIADRIFRARPAAAGGCYNARREKKNALC